MWNGNVQIIGFCSSNVPPSLSGTHFPTRSEERDVSLDEKSLSNEKLHELLQCCFSNQNGGRRNKKSLSVELSWKKRHLISSFVSLSRSLRNTLSGCAAAACIRLPPYVKCAL